MKTIAVICQKGGVGKTTIATALAVAAEQDGKSVALFDLDPQASACFWADRRKSGGKNTPVVRDVNHNRLPHYLEVMDREGADLVILDCPPVHRDISESALGLADLILVPTRPDALDIRAMVQTVKMSLQLGKRPTVVLTFCPPVGAEIGQARELVTEKLHAAIAPVEIHLRKAYSRAMQDGLSVQEYEASGKAAEEISKLYAYSAATLFGKGSHGKKVAQSRRRA